MQEDRPNFLPALTEPIFIFFDWGKASDKTVRTIGKPVGNGEDMGVYVYEMKEYDLGTAYSDILDELRALIKDVGFNMVAMVGWDNTGVGRGIEDFIKKIEEIGVSAMPVEFSTENKSRIYTTFKLLIEKNLRGVMGINIPRINDCDHQLAKLRFKRSPRGYLQVHHEDEKDRDDYPDALAGLCSLIIQPDSPPVTATIIGGSGSIITGDSEDLPPMSTERKLRHL